MLPSNSDQFHVSISSEDDEHEVTPSAAGVRELREEMMMMKGQLNELKQMMRVSFDLQLDIQRAVRQEVSAALSAFLASPQSHPTAANGGGHHAAQANCPIPTLGTCLPKFSILRF